MPRKKATRKTAKRKKQSRPKTPDAARDLGDAATDDLADAGAAVCDRAKEELGRARASYENVRGEVVDRLREIREGPAGELSQQVLRLVRRHPGSSIIVALLTGIFLGSLGT